eukprot:TRINITY_DN6934_c0_g1_i2.p1 TRINITY_DN6934_c0_g1~~TRINITY_DN6934_c0_g1_i2.p1  ORF type:complete len:150 (+),score=15.21 TRINITY_DN6934_c0_g1_i2:385-834(+)
MKWSSRKQTDPSFNFGFFLFPFLFFGFVPTTYMTYSILICIGGVLIVAFADLNNIKGGRNAILGDLLIIFSTLCTALYMVFYAKFMHTVSIHVIFLFLGLIGVDNLFLFWPGMVCLFPLLPFTTPSPIQSLISEHIFPIFQFHLQITFI